MVYNTSLKIRRSEMDSKPLKTLAKPYKYHLRLMEQKEREKKKKKIKKKEISIKNISAKVQKSKQKSS
jgi:hypothetical protein